MLTKWQKSMEYSHKNGLYTVEWTGGLSASTFLL